MQNHNWENSSCSISVNSTKCNQGSVPVIGVNATLPEHVQATIRFAAANNLRLTIKTTGHDYLGRSGAAGSLLLWLHHMKNMSLINQYSSCGRTNISNVARIGAGVQWGEVYYWLNQYNLIAIGGAASSVGAVGGYLQGGGHSPLSRWKGLAVDQVLEYDVVLPSGERQIASPCQNADLFWALSGGGGGTFAVVLSAVIRTYPSPSVVAAAYSIEAPSEARYARLIQSFIQFIPKLADAGWAGYFQMADLKLSGVFHLPNGDLNAFNVTLNEFAANNTDLDFSNTYTFAVPSFYAYFAVALAPNNPTGFNVFLSSRLISESIIRNDPNRVAQLFLQSRGQTQMGSILLGHLVSGGQAFNALNFNNSVNPAWRTSLLHMVYSQGWLDTTPEADQNYLVQQMTAGTQLLNVISMGPRGSCYLNEANPNEPYWQETFFGPKEVYDRLKSIKDTFDPNGLFVCKNCVGSEDWKSDLNCPNAQTSNSEKLNWIPFLLVIQMIAVLS